MYILLHLAQRLEVNQLVSCLEESLPLLSTENGRVPSECDLPWKDRGRGKKEEKKQTENRGQRRLDMKE